MSKYVLALTKTADFRHESIAKGISTLEEVCASLSTAATPITVVQTEDDEEFAAKLLADLQKPAAGKTLLAVAFLNTSGNILGDNSRRLFRLYIERGGGYVGVHLAGGTELSWDWYSDGLIGAKFIRHPEYQEASVHLGKGCCEPGALSEGSSSVKKVWKLKDEWYVFDRAVEGKGLEILGGVDVSSYTDSGKGSVPEAYELQEGNMPIAWRKRVGQGRAWYTSLGHDDEIYDTEPFRHLLRNGLRFVGRLASQPA